MDRQNEPCMNWSSVLCHCVCTTALNNLSCVMCCVRYKNLFKALALIAPLSRRKVNYHILLQTDRTLPPVKHTRIHSEPHKHADPSNKTVSEILTMCVCVCMSYNLASVCPHFPHHSIQVSLSFFPPLTSSCLPPPLPPPIFTI